MDIGKWTDITITIIMIVGIVASIIKHRQGKIGLGMTIGFVVMFAGVGIGNGLPIIVPSLTSMADKLSYLTGIGALILIGSMWIERRERAKSS